MAVTPLRNFRCDDERWTAFLGACAEEDTDASTQIRDMIDVWLEGREL